MTSKAMAAAKALILEKLAPPVAALPAPTGRDPVGAVITFTDFSVLELVAQLAMVVRDFDSDCRVLLVDGARMVVGAAVDVLIRLLKGAWVVVYNVVAPVLASFE